MTASRGTPPLLPRSVPPQLTADTWPQHLLRYEKRRITYIGVPAPLLPEPVPPLTPVLPNQRPPGVKQRRTPWLLPQSSW